jgi:hypothetical protein
LLYSVFLYFVKKLFFKNLKIMSMIANNINDVFVAKNITAFSDVGVEGDLSIDGEVYLSTTIAAIDINLAGATTFVGAGKRIRLQVTRPASALAIGVSEVVGTITVAAANGANGPAKNLIWIPINTDASKVVPACTTATAGAVTQVWSWRSIFAGGLTGSEVMHFLIISLD